MKTCVKQLSLTVVFVCICSAAGLECMTCADFTCSSQNPQNCSSWQTLCYTSAVNDSGRITIIKGCTSTDNRACTDGGIFYSYNYSSFSRLHNHMCCDSDRCNSAQLPIPAPPAGSLQCYGCDPHTYECITNVTCNVQEVCAGFVMSDVQPFYGCVSENICNSSLVFPGQSPVCCNTSHCNIPELGVQCSSCEDQACSKEHPVRCFRNSPCYTHTYIVIYNDGTNSTSVTKGCINENMCSIAQPELFSFNTSQYIETLFCCGSDGCNALPQPTPPAGSLQCYGCEYWRENCTYMSCDAGQSCTNISNYGRFMFGCVSNNLCNTRMLQLQMSPDDSVSCCNTTHCNHPAASASLSTTTTSATTTTAATIPAIPTSTAAPTTTTTDSGSVVFMKMWVDSLGTVSNTTLSEAITQFLREQLNSTDFVVTMKKIIETKTETNLTASAPPPT